MFDGFGSNGTSASPHVDSGEMTEGGDDGRTGGAGPRVRAEFAPQERLESTWAAGEGEGSAVDDFCRGGVGAHRPEEEPCGAGAPSEVPCDVLARVAQRKGAKLVVGGVFRSFLRFLCQAPHGARFESEERGPRLPEEKRRKSCCRTNKGNLPVFHGRRP